MKKPAKTSLLLICLIIVLGYLSFSFFKSSPTEIEQIPQLEDAKSLEDIENQKQQDAEALQKKKENIKDNLL